MLPLSQALWVAAPPMMPTSDTPIHGSVLTMVVAGIIFLGLFLYLVRLDRQVRDLEKQ
ncbi:MAG TPA: CcmD family protein [Armatimonadota bacterium]|jgi:CcmD family protein